jgi:hypothetical protein
MAFVNVNSQKTTSIVEKIEFGGLEITFHEVEEGVRRIVILPKPKHTVVSAVIENSLVLQSMKK